LFALSGNRCAFPRCTTALIQGDTVVGQICHIKAAKPGGPRYDDQQTDAERHAFANLILMCGTHHTVIDDDEEAYTVQRLLKPKAEHEKGAAQIDDRFAEHAAQLLIKQTVSSANQSGGITAHTVNADTINLHPPPILALGAGAPDWSIQQLFYYLRPNISPNGPTALWDEVGGDVLDKLSSGQLHAWGREIVRGATTTFLSLAAIDRTYWRRARFTYAFLLEEHERDVHATQHAPSALPDYADLQVNRENAVKLWPHPLRSRWEVQTITLIARYFNHPNDQVSVVCKTVTLFDAHIETKCDATGAPQYQQLIAPAYILATGVDPVFIRSLTWKPQELSFVDPTTNIEQQYMLTGTVDDSGTNGTVKFFLDPWASLPPPISPDTVARATEFFDARMNYIHAAIDAPAVLRHGQSSFCRCCRRRHWTVLTQSITPHRNSWPSISGPMVIRKSMAARGRKAGFGTSPRSRWFPFQIRYRSGIAAWTGMASSRSCRSSKKPMNTAVLRLFGAILSNGTS
jgi:hypothetical protein